jgi:hypothetical protein
VARVERKEALSIPGAQRSRNGRGSEHGAILVYVPRGAAQAGLTEGDERSSRLRHETNVEWVKISRQAEPRTVGKVLSEPDFLLAGSRMSGQEEN